MDAGRVSTARRVPLSRMGVKEESRIQESGSSLPCQAPLEGDQLTVGRPILVICASRDPQAGAPYAGPLSGDLAPHLIEMFSSVKLGNYMQLERV